MRAKPVDLSVMARGRFFSCVSGCSYHANKMSDKTTGYKTTFFHICFYHICYLFRGFMIPSDASVWIRVGLDYEGKKNPPPLIFCL